MPEKQLGHRRLIYLNIKNFGGTFILQSVMFLIEQQQIVFFWRKSQQYKHKILSVKKSKASVKNVDRLLRNEFEIDEKVRGCQKCACEQLSIPLIIALFLEILHSD